MNIKMLNEYIEIIILNILNGKDYTSYCIREDIDKRLNKQIDIKMAKIYLMIKKLEKENLIISYWIDNELCTRIKKYSITTKGKKYLKQKKTEWDNSKKIIDKLLGDK